MIDCNLEAQSCEHDCQNFVNDNLEAQSTTSSSSMPKAKGEKMNQHGLVAVTEPKPYSSLCSIEQKPWHHAMYHTTVSVLGGAVMASLPLGFACLGWWGGAILFLASTIYTYYSGWCLIELQSVHEATYSEIADKCMGPGFAAKYVRPFQALVFFVVNAINVLVIGMGYMAMDELVGGGLMSQSWWTVLGGLTFFMAALVPELSKQWTLSAAGSVAGVAIAVMLAVGCGLSIYRGSREEAGHEGAVVDYGSHFDDPTDSLFGMFNAFGIIALAYGGHSVLPDVQSTLMSRCKTDEDRHKAMKRGLTGAYLIIAPCYMIVGVIGYYAFGSSVSGFLVGDITPYLVSDNAFLFPFWFFVVVNTIALGAVYVQAAFTLLEDIFPSYLQMRNNLEADNGSTMVSGYCLPYSWTSLVVRFAFIALCTLVAAALPFFADLAGLIGAVGIVPLTFIYPIVFWNFSDRAKNAHRSILFVHWAMVIAWTVLGLGGMVGATYFIVQDSSTYGFFS